ncbi:MAG TPA: NAD(P)H-dependent oxidoreductase subunit E [Fibrobacteria bacterium]|jgi:NADH-quinone oxidoreductase subunit E|nr:NAD(P)H-dependent oxidoreductase subunit E [Fibrobacteria bacterium]
MTAKTLSPERLRQFHDWADEYPNKRSMLMMTLRLVEEEFGSIDDEGMRIAADLCGVNVAHVQGMVTFYTHFKRPAHGKHRFMVCATLMCALDGNTDAALAQIRAKLGLQPGQTSADGLFSCEKVECLADCDKPPVLQKDNEHFCSMKGAVLDEYIDSLLAREGKTPADYTGAGAPAPVATDLRVAVLPAAYTFPGETETGARRFDDKNPHGPTVPEPQAPRTTAIPPALKTPLTAPVAGTPFRNPGASATHDHKGGDHHG